MFAQLPYPPAQPGSPPVRVPMAAGPLDICVVAESAADLAAWNPLAVQGHRLCWLDASETSAAAPAGWQREHLRAHFAPGHGYTPLLSLCAYHWLAARRFDLVVFAGRFGLGYYSLVARDLGLAFADTALVVQADSCHALALETAKHFPAGRTDIELDFLERQCLGRADALVTTASVFTAWAAGAGWTLPAVVVNEATTELAGLRRPPPVADPPFISVCMATHNRPGLLPQAIESLLRQTYPHFEVILVDDGSSDPAVAAVLDGLEPAFQARGWTILRQANAGVAQARDRAVRAARGSHILFMDDDNLALAHELERFARAAASGADVITCIPGRHPDSDTGPAAVAQLPGPDPSHPLCGVDWTPVGACLALAAMVNCLGDCNALYRRDMILALGGYHGQRGSSFEDFRYLLGAVARGYRLEVLPEVLFLYRRHRQSRSMRDNLFYSHVDCLTPLAELMPKELWPLLLAVHRDWYDRHLTWAVKEEEK